MKKTLLLSFVAFGVTAFAAGNTFKVNLFQDSVIEGKTFKAGEYKISMENGNAVIKKGKETVELPAREETAPDKAASTALTFRDNTVLTEIRVGGTNTKIVFEDNAGMHAGQ